MNCIKRAQNEFMTFCENGTTLKFREVTRLLTKYVSNDQGKPIDCKYCDFKYQEQISYFLLYIKAQTY
jgi:hypothetical protein